MPKIKVINVISDSNIGGAGNMLLTYLRNYDRSSFDMTVVLPEKSLLIPQIKNLKVKYIEMHGIAESSLNIKSISEFHKTFSHEKPQIVHTHASMSARIAARLYGKCKIIHTRHSVFDVQNWKKLFPFKQIFGFINNSLSDIIIAVSPAAVQNMTDTGTHASKIKVVYNGAHSVQILSDDKKREERIRLNLGENDFVCAILARLELVKGHEYIIRAAKFLQDKDPSIKIIIAGTGSQEAILKELAKELKLKNCLFAGFVKDTSALENIMDLQLNASYGTEATSMSLLEGMSLGVPAVVSDFGGNPFVIENGVNGVVIPKKDSNAICKAIIELKNNEERYKKMKSASVDIFNSRFTDKIMTENIEKIYSSLYDKR